MESKRVVSVAPTACYPLRIISIGVCALALGAGIAAQEAALVRTLLRVVGATPQLGVHSDLGISNQI